LLECGAHSEKILTARGALYELEAAAALERMGETITQFGKKVSGREFDILTDRRLVECKNIDWSKLSHKAIDDLRSSLCMKKGIAESGGVEFAFYSKNTIPDEWRIWLSKKSINYFDH